MTDEYAEVKGGRILWPPSSEEKVKTPKEIANSMMDEVNRQLKKNSRLEERRKSISDGVKEQVEDTFAIINKLQNVAYYQTIELSYEEKKAVYRKLKKEQLIEMLIQCNNIIDSLLKPNIQYGKD